MAKVQGEFEMKYDLIFDTLRELPAQTGTTADRVDEIMAYTRTYAAPLSSDTLSRLSMVQFGGGASMSSIEDVAPPHKLLPTSPQHARVPSDTASPVMRSPCQQRGPAGDAEASGSSDEPNVTHDGRPDKPSHGPAAAPRGSRVGAFPA
jgi:hypothetical protein